MNYFDDYYFSGIRDICVEYLQKNYDYSYLSSMLKRNRTIGADTIIVGLSYAMNGIIENELYSAGDVISYSVSSQDLFYDYETVRYAVKNSAKPIKRCLINVAYYALYHDLSKCLTDRWKIPAIYMNLFGDSCFHNYCEAKRINPIDVVEFDRTVYPTEIINSLCLFWTDRVIREQGSYYGDLLKREVNNDLARENIVWAELDDSLRNNYAIRRTENAHKKHIRYAETRKENEVILNDMVEFLKENNIKTYFFVTPFTKEYLAHIDPGYSQDLYNTLDDLDFSVEFLDMNSYGHLFADSDFIDPDHLNLSGAHKATSLLNEFIEVAEGMNEDI